MIPISTLRTIQILFKLLPPVIALKRDRKNWIKTEGRIDEKRYRRNAKKLLDAFLKLGPVYIKLGQWLSSRADILPQPYMEELAKLQDSVPAAPFSQVRPILEEDLGPIPQSFDSIEEDALSGASLGQVHIASVNGQKVAVKIKRPGIENVVRKDLQVLKKVLPLALRFVDPNLRFSGSSMLAQFIETIREEMDYTIESDNLKRIKENMKKYGSVVVPGIYDKLSSKNVLTMEYIPGIKITDVSALDEKGIDRQRLVIDVHKVFFTMLLRHAVFHADPHPGNISVTDDGRLVLYDYGMVGRLDDETRKRLIRLYLALLEKDPSRTINAMSDLGMLQPGFNRLVMERAIELTVQAMHGRKPEEMEIKGLMELANRTMSRFPFVLPKHLALYMRMASIIEGIYKTHQVNFKFVRVLKEILEKEDLIKDAYVEEIKYSLKRFAKSIDDTISIAPELRRIIDENRLLESGSRQRPGALIAGSILSSAMFLGSVVLYSEDAVLGMAGMAGALAVMGIFAAFRKR